MIKEDSGMEANRYTHEPNTKDLQALYMEVMSYFVFSRVKSFGEEEIKAILNIQGKTETVKQRGDTGHRSEGIVDLVGQSKKHSGKQINTKTTDKGVKPFTNGCDPRVVV